LLDILDCLGVFVLGSGAASFCETKDTAESPARRETPKTS